MSSVEIVAFGALWVVVLAFGALVLLLYRQVERAYQGGSTSSTPGLLPGVRAPDIEILGDDGERPLGFPEPGEIALLAFVTSSCDACSALLGVLRERRVFGGRAIALVNGETTNDLGDLREDIEMEWLSHPPDVVRDYGINVAPTVYAVRGHTVLASRSVSTADGLERLLTEAHENARELGAEEATTAPPVEVPS